MTTVLMVAILQVATIRGWSAPAIALARVGLDQVQQVT